MPLWKRLLFKIGRFFWSRGFAIFLLCAVAFVVVACVLIDVEENWRGARDWAATKAKWEARGISFDRHVYVPPVVPDEKNLAVIPLFQITGEKDAEGRTGNGQMLTLQKAMGNQWPGHDLPPFKNGMQGSAPNLDDLRKWVAEDYAVAFKGSVAPSSPLAQFEAVYPFITALDAAVVMRPSFRLDQDYMMKLPAGRSLSPTTIQIKLSKYLTAHALLALDEHQSELALADMRVNFVLAHGVMQDPDLVGGLVGIGILAINNAAIWEGLALHAWNDDQLAQIQADLSQFDFLRAYQFAMRAEAIAEAVPIIDFVSENRKLLSGISFDEPPVNEVYFLWPQGWLDQNKRQIVDAELAAAELVDMQARRFDADRAKVMYQERDKEQMSFDAVAPWNFLFNVTVDPVVQGGKKYAQAQVFWIDEARIACGLERYRLAHGTYPDSLQALVPACIPELPHDVINGESYRYQLKPDGGYLLYSVGWNETDDGGKMVHLSGSGLDYDQGDWVWPMPKL